MFSLNSDLLWMFNTVHYIEGVCVCVCFGGCMFIHLYSAINTGHQPRKKGDLSKCKTACDLCMLINMIDVFLSCL